MKIHWIAEALGASTHTVHTWIISFRDGRKIGMHKWPRRMKGRVHSRWGYLEPRFKGKIIRNLLPSFTVNRVLDAFRRLARWLSFRNEHGWMVSLDDIASGVEPP